MPMIALVIWMSACEGVGSPEGWLCNRLRTPTTALKLENTLGSLIYMGAAIGSGVSCSRVILMLPHDIHVKTL